MARVPSEPTLTMYSAPTLRARAQDIGSEGHHRPHADNGHHRQNRREVVNQLIGAGGGDVFLGHQLERVGNGLKQALRANAVGAHAVLHAGHHPAFEPDQEQRQNQGKGGDEHNADDLLDDVDRAGRQPNARQQAGQQAAERAQGILYQLPDIHGSLQLSSRYNKSPTACCGRRGEIDSDQAHSSAPLRQA